MAPAKKQLGKGAPPIPVVKAAPKNAKVSKGGHHNKAANSAAWRTAQMALIEKDKAAHKVPVLKRRANGAPVVVRGATPRPTVYDEELGRKICLLFATDTRMTLGRLDADPAMPTSMTVYEWLRTEPNFDRLYARSRDIQFDRQAEETREVARTPLLSVIRTTRTGTDFKGNPIDSVEERVVDNVDRARLIVDTDKWLLSKQRPKKYGVQPIEVSDSAPLQDLLNQFRLRSQELGDGT